MRVLGIDIETSGLDFKKDKILEIGFVIKEVKNGLWSPKPLHQGNIYLWDEGYPDPMPPELYAIHKISSTLLKEVGREIESAFLNLWMLVKKTNVECIVAHNGLAFDKPFILEQTNCYSPVLDFFSNTPWVDTKEHLEYPADCKNKSLLYLSAYHGFLNPFPHDALSDVQTMMRIIQQYDFEKILKRATTPMITVKADVKFDTRELARARGYSWNGDKKQWEKKIPKDEFEKEKGDCTFQVIRID